MSAEKKTATSISNTWKTGLSFAPNPSFPKGALTDLMPLLPAISLSTFLDKWPPHFVFYVLEEKDRAEPDGERGELLHLERNKTYVLDLMMLAKSNANLHLAKRYYFPEKSE